MAGSKKLRQETIVWRDSWAGYNDVPIRPDQLEPGYYLVDVGWLARETRDEVLICSQCSAHTDDERVKYVTGIPKKNILTRSSRWVRVPDPRKAK